MDVELYIRNGSPLKHRNVKWLFTNQEVSEPLLVCPFLKALGLTTCHLLTSTVDRYTGSVDAESVLGCFVTQGDGRLLCVMEGIFHEHGSQNTDKDTEGSEEWCEIGTNIDKEYEESLAVSLPVAQYNGINSHGLFELESLLHQHRNTILVSYSGDPSVQVGSLQLRSSQIKKPLLRNLGDIRQ